MRDKSCFTGYEVLGHQSDTPFTVEDIREDINTMRGIIYKWQNKEMEYRQALWAGRMTETDYQNGLNVLFHFIQTKKEKLWAGMRKTTNTTRPPPHRNITGFDDTLALLDDVAGWVDENYKPPTFDLETGVLNLNGQPISLESNEESVLRVFVKYRATSLKVLKKGNRSRPGDQ